VFGEEETIGDAHRAVVVNDVAHARTHRGHDGLFATKETTRTTNRHHEKTRTWCVAKGTDLQESLV
jgi:hypothetical protein